MPQRLVPGETRRDPIQNIVERTPPLVYVYAMCRGYRGIVTFISDHKL
jgi:hypothetical protein